MAYAYLFKYIIIGDTGEAGGGLRGTRAGRRGKRRRRRQARVGRRGASFPPILPRSPGRRSISAVLALVTWALRAASAWLGLPCSALARCSRAPRQPFATPGECDSRTAVPGAPASTVSAARGGRGKLSELEHDRPRSGFFSLVPAPRPARFRLGPGKAHPEVGQPDEKGKKKIKKGKIFFFLKHPLPPGTNT